MFEKNDLLAKSVILFGFAVLIEAVSMIGFSAAMGDVNKDIAILNRNQGDMLKASSLAVAAIESRFTEEERRQAALRADHEKLRAEFDKHVRGFRPSSNATGSESPIVPIPDPIGNQK